MTKEELYQQIIIKLFESYWDDVCDYSDGGSEKERFAEFFARTNLSNEQYDLFNEIVIKGD